MMLDSLGLAVTNLANLGTSTMSDLIEYVKSIAPKVWAITVRQVYVEAWGDIAIGALALLSWITLSIVTPKISVMVNKNRNEHYTADVKELSFWLTFVITGVIALIIFFVCVPDGIKHLANPDFYALNWLLQQR